MLKVWQFCGSFDSKIRYVWHFSAEITWQSLMFIATSCVHNNDTMSLLCVATCSQQLDYKYEKMPG